MEPVYSAVPSRNRSSEGTYAIAWSNGARLAGSVPKSPRCPVRTITMVDGMPSSFSIVTMSIALSLQSPKPRANTWAQRYGLKPWMPNSSAT